MSQLAAAVTGDYLRTGDPSVLRHYDGAALRARFRGRLLLRDILSRLGNPGTVELGFRLLRTPPGRAAAARLLFADGSFPDTNRSRPRKSGASEIHGDHGRVGGARRRTNP
jgi:hypothetical protein